MTGEERARRSVKYLRNTDALGYEPEIEAEFQLVWNDAIETAASMHLLAILTFIATAIRELKVDRGP